MSEIQCSFATSSSSTVDMITARLKKPVGFKGSPLFADDRGVDPETDKACSIRPESSDPNSIAYVLKIADFSRCGVLKRNVNFRFISFCVREKLTHRQKNKNAHLSHLLGLCSCSHLVPTISGRSDAI